MKTETMDYKLLIDLAEPATKRAATLEQLTDSELNEWEEKQRELRRKRLEHLRMRGK